MADAWGHSWRSPWVFGASLRSCRPCSLREQYQGNGSATAKPRQVSVLLHPLLVGAAPPLWREWSRRLYRRACIGLLRHQRVEITLPQTMPAEPRHKVTSSSLRIAWDEPTFWIQYIA